MPIVGMRVLIFGAGRFGKSIAEVFCEHRAAFTDIVLVDRAPLALLNAPTGVRTTTSLSGEAPEIVVLAACAVPKAVRERLIKASAPFEELMKIEQRYNLPMMQNILPWIQSGTWKMLVIATNPVDDWVSAFHVLFQRRLVVGLGTAFDSRRIKCLAAALTPGAEAEIFRKLRIMGGHGTAITINEKLLQDETFTLARWMSNALSVAFIKAPEAYPKIWWKEVAIRPLVRGLAGVPTWTHLVVPFTYGGIKAATGLDVQVKHLTIHKRPLGRLPAETRQEFILYLKRMRRLGAALASDISGEPLKKYG